MDANAQGGANDAVACLNASTGSLRWRSIFPADKEYEVRSQGSTPCVKDGRLYVAGRKRVYCLDTQSGKLVWQQPIDSPTSGVSCSLAVVDGVAVLICQGFYGFDALTGKLRWRRAEVPGSWNGDGGWPACPSAVCWHHDGKNYVVCSCKSVELMDPATGRAIWKLPWTEGGWSSWKGNSSPTIVGDQMVIDQKAGGMEGYPLSLDTPTKFWHLPDHDCGTSPLIYEGHVYTIGGGDYGKPTSIRCADLQTGRINWEKPTQSQGCSSPIAADGKIFGYLKFGHLLCMWKADPENYSLLATATVKADGYSSLAFANGRLYLRLSDGVACYDVTRVTNPSKKQLQETAQTLALKFNQDQAAKGDMSGLLRMGERYRDGDGVPKDVVKACNYLTKAAAAGSPTAKEELSKLMPSSTVH